MTSLNGQLSGDPSSSGEIFSLGEGKLKRSWSLDSHGLHTLSLHLAGTALPLSSRAVGKPECSFDGLLDVPRRRSGRFPPLLLRGKTVADVARDVYGDRRRVWTFTWEEPEQQLTFVRTFTTYPGASAYVTQAGIRSESIPQTRDEFRQMLDNVVETIPIDFHAWRATCVAFYGRTDYHNACVRHTEITVDTTSPVELTGNLLFLEHPTEDIGLFVLHEAPPEGECRPETTCTFRLLPDGLQVMGWGMHHRDVLPHRMRWSYCTAVGAFSGGLPGAREELRRLLKIRYPNRENDLTVVANPWGDGGCYEKFCETYLLDEISAAAEIGASHYQIDDGWQSGRELARLTNDNWARPRSFWDIDSTKFPEGFARIKALADTVGVNLALWFAPDVARGYRNWEEERDILVALAEKYDIGLIKLDGVRLYTKDAEENLIALMEGVIEATEGRTRFNLDVTNGLRLGFFANLRFGSLFLENRYVTGAPSDTRTYTPWRVLRSLWQLAHYLPAERIQIEFANLAEAKRNNRISWDMSSANSAPNCSWDYVAAITLMASPLCWLSPSGVPPEARPEIKRMMDLHRHILPELNKGQIVPVGDEPSGTGITGFQCHDPDVPNRGLLLLFREDTLKTGAVVSLRGCGHAAGVLRLSCLSHSEDKRKYELNDGVVTVELEEKMSFRLFRYEAS